MKIRVLTILIVCLSLHTLTVFGHPKPEGMTEAEHDTHHEQREEELENRLDDIERRLDRNEE